MNPAPNGLRSIARKLAVVGGVVLVFFLAASQSPAQESSPTRSSAAQIVGTSQGSSTTGAMLPELQHRNARYLLCASDTITLTFPLTPEFDQTVDIQPDGFANLAGVGDVHLEGLSTEETARAVRIAYAKLLRDPIVVVELKNFSKPYFVVGGQVHQPGKYDLHGYTTATQAIAIAGGFNETAKHSQVLLFRRVNNDWLEVKNLNLKRILQGHGVGEDPEIRPGDMLFVVFNFRPAKIFMGDSGSTMLGLALAFLALDFCRSNGAAMPASTFPLFVAALPLVDAALAIIRRLRRRASPFTIDRRHLYDLLLARGWPPRRVALVWYSATLLFVASGWLALRGNSIRSTFPGIAAIALLLVIAVRLGCLRSTDPQLARTVERQSFTPAPSK